MRIVICSTLILFHLLTNMFTISNLLTTLTWNWQINAHLWVNIMRNVSHVVFEIDQPSTLPEPCRTKLKLHMRLHLWIAQADVWHHANNVITSLKNEKKTKHLKMKATYRTCGKINMENWRLYIITCGNPLYFEMCETTCEETRWLFTCDDKCDFKGQCIGIFVYLFLCHEWNREKVWRERERERYPCSSYSSEFYSASFVLTCRCVCVCVDLQFLQDCRWWQTS